jgi:MFS family permease
VAFASNMPFVKAESAGLNEVYFFDDPLCQTCQKQKAFLSELQNELPELEINQHPISDVNLLYKLANDRNMDQPNVIAPSTFVGQDYFFQFSEFTAEEEDILLKTIRGELPKDASHQSNVKVPFFGEVNSEWSLIFLAITLGLLDGFNVCSIGALILILSIVLAFNSRKKIILFGGMYIVTATLTYGLLVFVWGQLIGAFFTNIGFLRIFIGLASLAGSIWFFKEFWRFYKYGPTCNSSNSKIAKNASNKLVEKLQNSRTSMIALLSSVVLFAIVITVVELPCSLGIPVAFTGILAETGVSGAQFAFYVGIYLLFYMLIELIVFLIAVFTKTIWLSSSNAITWITLAGALILMSLGVYYLGGVI